MPNQASAFLGVVQLSEVAEQLIGEFGRANAVSSVTLTPKLWLAWFPPMGALLPAFAKAEFPADEVPQVHKALPSP